MIKKIIVKMCERLSSLPTNVSFHVSRFSMEIVERSTSTCMGCQLIMGSIHGLLENAMHDSLLPYLREKCEDVGPTVDAELCRSFTGEKGKILAGMVADVLEANTFCYLVRLCSPNENKKRELML